MQELWNQLIKMFTDTGVSKGVAVAYIIVGVLIVLMAIVALIMRIVLFARYHGANKRECSGGRTSFQVAHEALVKAGMGHIQVKKSGFFRALIFGNSYSLRKKTIFLRRGIADKNSLTAVGVALQKVGIAKLCESGDKAAITRNVLQYVGLFGPFLFIPFILVGVVVDMLLFNVLGNFSIGTIVAGIAVLSISFVVTLLNIPVEKKGNKAAMQMLDEIDICTEEEKEIIKNVLDTYIIMYICDFIINVLRLLQYVLEIVMRMQQGRNGK